METALNEITLVLFTTIAPAGVIGYLAMALAVVSTRDEGRACALSRHLVVPLVLAISGLIASDARERAVRAHRRRALAPVE